MLKDNRENIHDKVDCFMPITLFGNKIKVGIIGGGKAALIKTRYFLNKNVKVKVLSRDFSIELRKMLNDNLELIKGEYNKEFILDKHIIIIAIDDFETINRIKKDCDDLSKIYISSYSFKDGMGVIPVTRESKNFNVSLNSKCGNPKGSLIVADKIVNIMHEYDEFIEYSSRLRENIKNIGNIKSELIDFVISEDYKFFKFKDKEKIVLKLFYDEDIANKVLTMSDEVK